MGWIYFLLLILHSIRGYGGYTFNLTKSSDFGIIGDPFSFTCNYSGNYLQFTSKKVGVYCTVDYQNGNCSQSACNNSITCNSSNIATYTVTQLTDNYHKSKWNCSNPALPNQTSSTEELCVKVPVTTVDLSQIDGAKGIEHGKTVKFQCTTNKGRPSSRIQWYLNNNNNLTKNATLQGPFHNQSCESDTASTRSELEYTGVVEDNGKQLYCTASNIDGRNVSSQTKTLFIWYSPKTGPNITQTPAGPVNASSSVNLTCEVHGGNPLANITWQCDLSVTAIGSEIQTVKTVSSIAITVSKDDNGKVCVCNASHPVWKPNRADIYSLDVRYEPMWPPNITQSKPGPIIEGNKIILTCEVFGGNPLANVSWQCDGNTSLISAETSTNDKTISSVELNVSRDFNSKECFCLGRHIFWTEPKKRNHALVVYYSSTAHINNPKHVHIKENTSVQLSCTADGNPVESNFTWYRNNSMSALSYSSQYIITQINRTDKGYYWCGAWNGIGKISFDYVFVDVLYIPDITNIIVNNGNQLQENETAVLSCNVSSNPLSNVTWKKDGFPLSSSTNVLYSEYTLNKLSCYDAGNYHCTATNRIDDDSFSASGSIMLLVFCSPRYDHMFNQPEMIIRMSPGQNLTIHAHMLAYPKPNVEWSFKENANSSDKIVISNCDRFEKFRHLICYEKANLQVGGFGRYSVNVSNQFWYKILEFIVEPKGLSNAEQNSDIGVAVGMGIGFGSLVIVIIVIVLIVRRMRKKDGLKDNILYESAGQDFEVKNNTDSAAYAMVRKVRGKQSDADEVQQNKSLYAAVQKSTHLPESVENQRNVQQESSSQTPEVYIPDKKFKSFHQYKTNKDGLVYADLVFSNKPKGRKFIIHGIDNKTNYADIDLELKADPRPSDDSDTENVKEKK